MTFNILTQYLIKIPSKYNHHRCLLRVSKFPEFCYSSNVNFSDLLSSSSSSSVSSSSSLFSFPSLSSASSFFPFLSLSSISSQKLTGTLNFFISQTLLLLIRQTSNSFDFFSIVGSLLQTSFFSFSHWIRPYPRASLLR